MTAESTGQQSQSPLGPEGPPTAKLTTSIGARIAHARKQARVSQKQLASLLGLTQTAISQWEQEQTIPRLEQVDTICRTFGVSADWLLNGETQASDSFAFTLHQPPQPQKHRGLTTLQLATLEALENALGRKLLSNERCLELLTELHGLLDKTD